MCYIFFYCTAIVAENVGISVRRASWKLNSNEKSARIDAMWSSLERKFKRMFRIAGKMLGEAASICALRELACQKKKKEIEAVNNNKHRRDTCDELASIWPNGMCANCLMGQPWYDPPIGPAPCYSWSANWQKRKQRKCCCKRNCYESTRIEDLCGKSGHLLEIQLPREVLGVKHAEITRI